MKSALLAMLLLIGLVGCSGKSSPPPPAGTAWLSDPMQPFKCELTMAANEQAFAATLFFYGPYALEYDNAEPPRLVALYDLDRRFWTDLQTGTTTTMADCERWGTATIAKTRKSLPSVKDPDMRRFVELGLSPQFRIAETDDTIFFENEVLTYRMSEPLQLAPVQKQRFFAYDRLNAYRKAMQEKKVPPYPQLAVDEELDRRGFVPGKGEIVIRAGANVIFLQIDARVANLTPAEADRVRGDIQTATSQP